MNIPIFPQPSDLHHAYILYGHEHAWKEYFKNWLRDTHHEHDMRFLTYETISIDDVRALKRLTTTQRDTPLYIFMSCDGIGWEAQHALLKTLEEPSPYTHIFLIAPHYVEFLPTIHSRVHILEDDRMYTQEVYPIEKFITETPQQRLEFIKKITGAKASTKLHKRDLYALTASLETYYEKERNSQALSVIYTAMQYIHMNGSSLKMILEYLALSLPEETLSKASTL